MAAAVASFVQLGRDFKFEPGVTLLGTPEAAVGTGVAYLVLVIVWRHQVDAKRARLAKERGLQGKDAAALAAPLVPVGDLVIVTCLHNLLLSVWSAVMFIGLAVHLVDRATGLVTRAGSDGEGWFWIFCESSGAQPVGGLFFWAYVYYLSKYYELLDTVIQLVRGRHPPSWTLHVVHHSCVITMAWAWVRYTMSLFAIGLLFNTGVHTVMYAYYALRSLGREVPWKRLVTKLQNIQFFTSFVCFVYTMYLVHGKGHTCQGTRVLIGNLLFNIWLFHEFFLLLLKGKPKKVKEEQKAD